MILGVLLGFAVLAVITSVISGGGTGDIALNAEESEFVLLFGNQENTAYIDKPRQTGPIDTIAIHEGLEEVVQAACTGKNGPITINDFMMGEDTLVYAFDANGAVPEMSLDHSQDSSGAPRDALVFANGRLVAIIRGMGGTFGPGDVVLAPLRSVA